MGTWFWAFICRWLPLRWAVEITTARKVSVQGNSMAPSVLHGWTVYGSRLVYRVREPARGDIVLAISRYDSKGCWVTRIVGMPGETVRVQAGLASIDGTALDEPYLLGDGQESVEVPADSPSASGPWATPSTSSCATIALRAPTAAPLAHSIATRFWARFGGCTSC